MWRNYRTRSVAFIPRTVVAGIYYLARLSAPLVMLELRRLYKSGDGIAATFTTKEADLPIEERPDHRADRCGVKHA